MNEGLDGKKVAIIGLGASGSAAARLALTKGGEVYVSDLRAEAAAAAGGTELRALGADVEWGGHDLDRVARADLVVVSPGIPPGAPVLRGLRERGVGWISEPELAVRFYRGPLIAITGTNGKTTLTMLTAHLLEESGLRVACGGNVGGGLAPAASELALLDPAPEWYVLELSSFQLGATETLRPDIGVVSNLSPDHLDHYATVEDYYADKARLFRNADALSRWVFPLNDERVERIADGVPGRRFTFTEGSAPAASASVEEGVLTLRTDGDPQPILPAGDLPLLGAHNLRNALAAALAARLAGARPSALESGLRSARPLPHRLEPVLERDGVLWVNDSKATNVSAARTALESFDRPLVALLGGKDKGEDFGPLRDAMGRVRMALAYGAAGARIAEALEGAGPVERVDGSFEEVVRRARGLARPGDAVLLAPACSSFDMFSNYEERGRRFAELARSAGEGTP